MTALHRSGVALCTLLLAGTGVAADNLLTLEQIYHPEQKQNFEPSPLTRLSWDKQDRLVEAVVKDGKVQLFAVDIASWQKTPLAVDADLLAWLQAAGIDSKAAESLAETLGGQMTPEQAIYVFSHNQDLWLLDRDQKTVRKLTDSPSVSEDEALLAPDNQKVAFLRGNDLYLITLADNREQALTRGGSDTRLNGRLDWVYQEELYGRGNFRAFWWAPDSAQIAYLSFDESKVPVFTLPGDHSQPQQLNQTRYPKAGDPNPIVTLGVVNLQGETRWLPSPYGDQETLIVQVGWTPNGELLASWQNREQTWLDLRRYDAAGNSAVMVRETSPAWVERLPLPTFLKDGGFVWESDRTGHRHLYRYDKRYKLRNAITKGNWDVREVLGVDDGPDSKSGKVYFTANERNALGNDAYVASLNGGKAQRLSEARGSHSIRWNKAWTHYLDSWSSLNEPPKQALFDASGKLVKLVDDSGLPETMRALKLGEVKFQTIKARDGYLLDAMLVLPPGFDANRLDAGKKYPVFQHLYAGPMAPQVTDRWNSRLWFQLLAQHGYVVWVLDNRSASNKGVKSAWPIHRKFGQLELQDQLDGIEWLRSQGWADMDRIALNGWSFGGYFTAYAMTRSKAWKIGFVGAPVTDWSLYDSIYTERYMGLPKANADGYAKGSVLNAVKDLSGKILIMHGTADDNVHPQNSIMLIDALIKAGKDYELQLYPGHGHGVRGDWPIWSQRKAMWRFLRENL